MSWLSRIAARIASTFRREQLSLDVRDELECHLSLLTEQNLKNGIPYSQARSEAMRALGNVDAVRDEYFRAAGFPVLDRLFADTRQALLEWRRDRALSAAVVLLLTIGIAVAAFAFAVAPQLRSLSCYGTASRDVFAIVHYSDHALGDWNRLEVSLWDSPAEYVSWKSAQSLDELTIEQPAFMMVEHNGTSTQMRGYRVDRNFFRVLGARAALGEPSSLRGSWNDDDGVVLSDSVWKTVFGSDPQIIGRKVRIDGRELDISGVMPPGFLHPGRLWLPLHWNNNLDWMKTHQTLVLARLQHGVSRRRAGEELRKLAPIESGPNEEVPKDATTELVPAQRLVDDIDDESIRVLMWIGAGILAAACVNATTLLLQRTIRRGREFSVRGALGAPHSRLTAELALEVFLLATLACLLAISSVAFVDWLLVFSFPQQFSVLPWRSIFGWECLYAVLLTLLLALLCTLPSAIQARRCAPLSVSRPHSRALFSRAGDYRDTCRSVLVGCQIAFALCALIGAGEMFRTFSWQWMKFRLRHTPENLLAVELRLKLQNQVSREEVAALYDKVLRAGNSIQGIDSVAITSQPPFHEQMIACGRPMLIADNHSAKVFEQFVSPRFFEQFSIPLIRGRLLDEKDGLQSPVAVISEHTAHAYFGTHNAVGQRVCQPDGSRCMTVVGIVGDFQSSYYSSDAEAALYRPLSDALPQLAARRILLLRTKGNAEQYSAAVTRALANLDPALHVGPPESMSRSYESSTSQYGTLTSLFAMFSATAIVLAVVGVYGLVLQWTASRIREIAIRIALGAREWNILEITTRRIASLCALAMFGGLPLAAAAATSLGRILGMPVDKSVFVASAVGLGCVIMLGTYLPARSASRTNPVVALRQD